MLNVVCSFICWNQDVLPMKPHPPSPPPPPPPPPPPRLPSNFIAGGPKAALLFLVVLFQMFCVWFSFVFLVTYRNRKEVKMDVECYASR